MTRPARNGVDVPSGFAVIDGAKGQPGMAQFQFRAGNKRIDGTHNHSAIQGFLGRGQDDISRTEPCTFDVAHPAVMSGDSNGPAAVEFPLHATAGCLTCGLANTAAARGVTLHRVSATVRGDIDLLRILGFVRHRAQRLPAGPGQFRDQAMPPGGTRRTGRAVPAAGGRLQRVGQRRRCRRRRHPAIGGLTRPPLNGSTPDPGTPGAHAGPDNQGVHAGPRPLPRAACRRAERARL